MSSCLKIDNFYVLVFEKDGKFSEFHYAPSMIGECLLFIAQNVESWTYFELRKRCNI